MIAEAVAENYLEIIEKLPETASSRCIASVGKSTKIWFEM